MTKQQRTAVRGDELTRYRYPVGAPTVLEPGVFAYMALVDGDRAKANRLFAAQDRLTQLMREAI